MKRMSQFVVIACVLFTLAAPAAAAECVGVSFPGQASVDGDKLTLNGLGLREATAFNVDVYVAALYVPKKSKSASKLVNQDTKKRLVLRFVRDVDKSDVQKAIREGMEKSKFGGDGSLRAKAKKVSGWMGDVEEGDAYTYTYVPGEGLTVEFNGKKKGTVEGATFAKAFFDIWLGSKPPNKGLKTGLLGGSCN